MDDDTHSTMDIRSHEKDFANFIRMVTWGVVIVFVVLIILALADG